jgi:hypothetical protein
MADLGDGQVPLALLERLHHRQATGQRGHEIRIAGQRLDTLGRRSDDRRRHGGEGVAHLIVHFLSFLRHGSMAIQAARRQCTRVERQHWAIIELSTDNRNPRLCLLVSSFVTCLFIQLRMPH